MSSLLKNTSYYSIGIILPKVAGFILLPIYTTYLSIEDFGIVAAMNVLYAFLIIFFLSCYVVNYSACLPADFSTALLDLCLLDLICRPDLASLRARLSCALYA